jgi:glutathione synthase/RimK-type ligase-like ATP-grasp enzyme
LNHLFFKKLHIRTIFFRSIHVLYEKEVISLSKSYKSKGITGKYRVYKYLSTDTSLKKYLPDTVKFSKGNLENMMNKYSALYVKPMVGSHGNGIYKIIRKDQGYKLRSTSQSKVYSNHSTLYQKLSAYSKKNMIIQQGIELELVAGRPYDIRAMVQRRPKGNWTCTGIFAKVGNPNKIVTNYYQGGRLYTLDNVFNKMNLSSAEKESRKSQLNKIAVDVAKLLNSKRSGMFEMGIDFAYDMAGNLWILEVNSNRPQFFPLKKIDRSMYNRILSYARSYRRNSG